MDRIVKFKDLEAAVAKAYEDNKSLKEGEVDPRLSGRYNREFAVAVGLTDGSLIVKGDSDTKFVLGSIAKLPVAAQLLSQFGPEELLKKSGCCCKCHHDEGKEKKADLPLCRRGVRAVSAVEPTGDPEGKWDVIINLLNSMMVNPATLDDRAYEAQLKLNREADVVNTLAKEGFYLYDSAEIAVDTYSKLQSMSVDVKQLATLGATLAADGVNPVTNIPAFDGALTQHIVGLMAAHGLHKMNKGWLMAVGVPAKGSFGGGVLAVVPGVMSVAAFSPELNEKGVSVKAAKAVAEVLRTLDISVFASARVKIEK